MKLRVLAKKEVNRGEVVGDAEQIDISMGAGGAETVQLFSSAAEDPAVHILTGQ